MTSAQAPYLMLCEAAGEAQDFDAGLGKAEDSKHIPHMRRRIGPGTSGQLVVVRRGVRTIRPSVLALKVADRQRIRPRPREKFHVTGNIKVGVASVQAAYKRYSFVYDNVFGKLLEAGRKSATDIVNTRAGDEAKVLEVGVGTGLSLASYRADLQVYGVDISMDMLKKASNRTRNGQANAPRLLLQMDAEKLAFRDGQFSFVVAMYVASVVPDLNALLGEVARVCRPAGEIIIVNHFRSSNRILSRIEDAIAPLYRYIGFRPDLTMDSILSDARFELKGAQPTNLFGEWCVLHLERRGTC